MTAESADVRLKKIYALLWGICIVVAVVAIIFYKFGYRLSSDFEPVKVGAIEISSNQKDFQVYINNREQKIPSGKNHYVIGNITPGLHSIVVSKEGFWPWTKTISVLDNSTRKIYAFMFPTGGISVKIIDPKSSDYPPAEKAVRQSKLPELLLGSPVALPDESILAWLDSHVPERKLSSDQSTVLYLDGNTVFIVWISSTEPVPHYFCEENPCKLLMPVIVSSEPIKSVDFYKDRRDLIIFSASAAIYAIEVDREGTQNFQPLFRGKEPYFYEEQSGVLYIKDGDSLLSASL